jgi:hypothetical protein
MGTQKMSLANIQGKLSRTEMKNIMAGSGAYGNHKCCWTGTSNCSACVSTPGASTYGCTTGATLTDC